MCYINNIMHFAFITSSFVALADGANPSDRILSETLPTLPEKGEDSLKDIMALPKGVLLDVTKSLSSPYSLKHVSYLSLYDIMTHSHFDT
jgi:hypothetical protein